MHTCFCSQQPEGVLAFNLQGGTFDARNVTWRLVFQCCLESFALCVFQVLAQKHAGPVASLRATSACLYVEKCIERIGGVVEHAPEFEFFHLGQDTLSVFFYGQKS